MSSARDPLPESTRVVRTRLRDSVIADLRAALAATPPAGVREVRLIGSWARGDFDGRSDIDLLVVTEGEDTAFDTLRLPKAERIDAVVVPADRLARFLADRHGFYTKAMADSVLIHRSGS